MGRPYGKIERSVGRSPRQKKSDSETFKVKLRGRDNAPLTMPELQQGLLEVVQQLRTHNTLRAKHVTIYMKVIDKDGKPVLPDPSGEWEIIPYKSAADELGT